MVLPLHTLFTCTLFFLVLLSLPFQLLQLGLRGKEAKGLLIINSFIPQWERGNAAEHGCLPGCSHTHTNQKESVLYGGSFRRV